MIKQFFSKYFMYLLLALCVSASVFTITRVYWGSTFPYTHDGNNHLARFASYKLALREGHFPPRISPNLMNRYGYPVFNFNYPLANILSVPGSLLKLPYEKIFFVQVVIAMAIAWTGVFYGLRLSKKKIGESIIFSSLYLSTPYISTALLFRGTIGEVWAYALLPWIWCSTFWIQEIVSKSKNKSKLISKNTLLKIATVVTWVSFMLAHNISLVLSVPFVLALSIYQFGVNRSYYVQALKLGFLAFCLSAWFWIPAYIEKNQTVLADAELNNEYVQHFLTLDTLFFSSHNFGYSLPGHSNTFAPSFGLPLVFVTVYLNAVFVILLGLQAAKKIKPSFTRTKIAQMSDSLIAIKAIPLFVAAALFAFLALPASQFVISVFPFLSYVQFPWRWLLMLPIACIVAFSAIKQPIPKVIQLFLIGAILMQMLIILRSTPADRFHRPNQYYEYFTMSTSTMNENLPKTFLYPEISEWEPTPIIAQGTASATVNYWKGSSRKYTLVAETDITVIEPTMYFSGWRTFVVNQETQKKSKVEYIDSKEIGGRIAYTLPKGSYQVKSAFSDLTLPRIIGDVLSILGIIFCIQWIGRLLLTKK